MLLMLDTDARDALQRGRYNRFDRTRPPTARTLRRLGFRPGLCTPALPQAQLPPQRDREVAGDWQPL